LDDRGDEFSHAVQRLPLPTLVDERARDRRCGDPLQHDRWWHPTRTADGHEVVRGTLRLVWHQHQELVASTGLANAVSSQGCCA